VFVQTVALAAKLGVRVVNTFSGCPGSDPRAAVPAWIVSPWPPEHSQALEWQWRERVRPYWEQTAAFCRKAGVKVAVEMHPNFVVYNAETMNQLRAIAPAVIGCNFDPSHLFWQGADPVAAIRAIGDGIFHVHAKDCKLDAANVAANGVVDAKPYTRERERSWIFRTVGYGHGAETWKAIVSALRLAGYDHVLSIEHEDSLMSGTEGLRKAIAFLKDAVIAEPAGEAYWA
jgi:sugar phosphate isomerase/epimerase